MVIRGKKLISAALSLCLILSFGGCGKETAALS